MNTHNSSISNGTQPNDAQPNDAQPNGAQPNGAPCNDATHPKELPLATPSASGVSSAALATEPAIAEILKGDDGNNAAISRDSNVSPGEENESCVTMARPIKDLRELNLPQETIKMFGIDHAYGIGLVYPIFDINGVVSQQRVYPTQSKTPVILWANSKLCPSERPRFYNIQAIKSGAHQQGNLFVVSNEVAVWIMAKNGIKAICCIGKSDYLQLTDLLIEHKVELVTAIFENTLQGRREALAMSDAMKGKICLTPLLLDCASGVSSDEWIGFEPERFRKEIEFIPKIHPVLIKSWQENPDKMSDGLPKVGAEECGLLQCLDENELAQLPRPQRLIEDTLLGQGFTLLTGRHASGKSFVALDMALSISQGHPWQGKKTQSGAAFYFSGEGTEGLYNRICAWKQTHGVEAVPNFAVVNGAVYIVDAAARRRVIDTVRAQLQKMNLAPDGAALLVFDTLARYRGALDESSPTDMGQFTGALEEIGRELGAAVLLVHHNNRDDTYRGSSVLPANATGHLEISNPPSKGQGQKIKIRVAKLKDFAQGHSLTLGSQVVEIGGVDEFGKPLSSLVLVLDKSAETKGEQLSPKENDALQALVQLGDVGATSTVWKKAAAAKGVSSTSFDRARIKLLAEHAVECDNSDASGALYKAVEGWSDSPGENDEKNESNVEDDENEAPLVPYHYQLKEGDPEVDEWNPVGEWIVRYKRES